MLEDIRLPRQGVPYDLICVGTALVDSVIKGFDPAPVSASGYRARSITLHVGGEAVNVSMAAAKLGLRTAILCALGPDEAGNMIRSALEANGVETGMIVQVQQTPVTTMFVRDDGTRKSITSEAHRIHFHPEQDPVRFTGARALALGSLFRAPFDDPEIIHGMIQPAKQAGEIIFADTKLPNFSKLTLPELREVLPLIDYITPNEDEAGYFTGETEPEKMADVFLKSGVKHVIIKLGREGCLLKDERETLRLPGYATDAVDATGAGDNFLAGLISEILQGRTQAEALHFANACGAICTTAVGAGTALRNREQVLHWGKT